MTRRGDPERIYQAQRAGAFRRLVDGERVNELGAEHLIRTVGARGRGDRSLLVAP
jgi:hypothetical protein